MRVHHKKVAVPLAFILLLSLLVLSACSADSEQRLPQASNASMEEISDPEEAVELNESPQTILASVQDSSTNLWGCIDVDGQWVIEPRYDDPLYFSEGLAAVYDSGVELYGYIDIGGNWVIEPQFAYYGDHTNTFDGFSLSIDFSNGLAPVATDTPNGVVFGYVDTEGNWAIKPQFDHAEAFSEGFACVRDAYGEWGYIDTEGNWLIKPIFPSSSHAFSEGLALVGGLESGKLSYGYIDVEGQWAIEPVFRAGGHAFKEGLAYVQEDSESHHNGFINMKGVWAIAPQFFFNTTNATHFSEGLAPISAHDAKYSDEDVAKWRQYLIENFGQTEVSVVTEFPETDRPPIGYIDTNGNWAIEPQFALARNFSEGLAIVENPALEWAVINVSGERVVEFQKGWIGDFSEGLAYMYVEKTNGIRSAGYIDRKGEWAIEPRFEQALSFHDSTKQHHDAMEREAIHPGSRFRKAI